VTQNPINAVIFDLDGTIYLGSQLIKGADDAVARLRQSGKRVVFLTNKPIDSPETYANKLVRMGIPADPQDIITSVRLTIEYLNSQCPSGRIYAIGETYLMGQLQEAGFTAATSPEETDIVVLSLDRHVTYDKLLFAFEAVKAGSTIVATNPDMICPTDTGDIIDAGAWIAAIEKLLGRSIDDVIGKPSDRCAEMALSLLGCEAGEALMVGDRLETDIRMAVTTGMRSALVLSGVTNRDQIARSDIQPDYVWESVADLTEALALR
jgi:HAD superfamily hydrolase (TIGR01450 family)